MITQALKDKLVATADAAFAWISSIPANEGWDKSAALAIAEKARTDMRALVVTA